MKKFTIILLALASLTSAKICHNMTVPIDISARNGNFDKALAPVTDVDVTDFILNLARHGVNYTQDILKDYNTISGSYNIAATYCSPSSGVPNTIQVLVHGIGLDRSYWNNPFHAYNYSYINSAVDTYGFATFSYDRLGSGMSSGGEPLNELQAQLEVAALKALTDKVRVGSIHEEMPKFEKVLHVGHSYGSQQIYALTAMYPNSSDGVVLSGFSQGTPFLRYFLLGSNFVRTERDGYLAPGNPSGLQASFFGPGDFDPALLNYTAATGSPVSIGQLLTFGGLATTKNKIKAPVLIINGQHDIPFCGGNCLPAPGGSIPESSKRYLPNAAPFKVSIVRGAGHGLNYEYAHPTAYRTILNFFVENGLGNGNGKPSATGKPGEHGEPLTAKITACGPVV